MNFKRWFIALILIILAGCSNKEVASGNKPENWPNTAPILTDEEKAQLAQKLIAAAEDSKDLKEELEAAEKSGDKEKIRALIEELKKNKEEIEEIFNKLDSDAKQIVASISEIDKLIAKEKSDQLILIGKSTDLKAAESSEEKKLEIAEKALEDTSDEIETFYNTNERVLLISSQIVQFKEIVERAEGNVDDMQLVNSKLTELKELVGLDTLYAGEEKQGKNEFNIALTVTFMNLLEVLDPYSDFGLFKAEVSKLSFDNVMDAIEMVRVAIDYDDEKKKLDDLNQAVIDAGVELKTAKDATAKNMEDIKLLEQQLAAHEADKANLEAEKEKAYKEVEGAKIKLESADKSYKEALANVVK